MPDRSSAAVCVRGMALVFMLFAVAVSAQSGRGSMHGYVAFEDVSYNDVETLGIRATVELRDKDRNQVVRYTTRTNEHGLYDFGPISMGIYILRISAAGHTPYQTEVYIPSDFIANLATMLHPAPGSDGKPKGGP